MRSTNDSDELIRFCGFGFRVWPLYDLPFGARFLPTKSEFWAPPAEKHFHYHLLSTGCSIRKIAKVKRPQLRNVDFWPYVCTGCSDWKLSNSNGYSTKSEQFRIYVGKAKKRLRGGSFQKTVNKQLKNVNTFLKVERNLSLSNGFINLGLLCTVSVLLMTIFNRNTL